MNYKEEYSGLKFRIRNAERIWEDYDDGRSDEEKQKIASEQIAEALHDYNVVFLYSDSGTMLPIYSKLCIFDRETDNLVLESGKYGEPNEILFKTIGQGGLDEIKAIIHSNQWLLKVTKDDTIGAMMTDGTIQEFSFSDNGSTNYFTTDNFGFQSTFKDAKKDHELESILDKILNILKKNGMPKNFFTDEEE